METQLPIQYIIVYFLGGLAVFLYGMRTMSSGMNKISGERIRSLMSTLTENRFLGMLTGAFATMIVQSSSAVIVMLVGLVQSRVMTYVQAMGVVLGAEIGTTANAQLIAFRLHDYALIIFALGFLVQVTARKPGYRHIGEAIAGFGLLFFGMQLMSEAMIPLRSHQPFLHLIENLSAPYLSVLIGMGFTALIQSSSAFVGIIIVMAQQGALGLEASIPLMLGANIGTCITASIASAGTFRPAKRVALAQILFNLTSVLFFLCFIPEVAAIVRSFSPTANGTDVGQLASVVPRQIANAHTLYNLLMAFVFLPITPLFARLVLRLLPDKPEESRLIPMARYLKKSALASPALALSYTWAEVGRMNEILDRMLVAAIKPFMRADPGPDAVFPQLSIIDGIQMREQKIDYLEAEVTTYLFEIMRQELSPRESAEVFTLLNIVKDQEALGDVIEVRMLSLLQDKQSRKIDLSQEGKEEISALHELVCHSLSQLTEALQTVDTAQAAAILERSGDFGRLEVHTEHHHLKRVQNRVVASKASHDLHMELVDALKQIQYYCEAIAENLQLKYH